MADPKPRRVTSADVARDVGLSRATVSYVLNDTPHQSIPPETRRRVHEAAARLGYAPSAAARELRSGRSDVVLCLLPDWPVGPEVGALLSNVSGELARHGMTFAIHPITPGARPTAQIWKTITPAAVLAFERYSAADMTAMRAAGVALVVTPLGRTGAGRGELDDSQQRLGRMQAEHLVAAGHTTLGYAFPDDTRLRHFADPRLAGVRTACAELGIDAPLVETVPLHPDAAATCVRRWLAAGVGGVCAYNDDVALAVLAGLRVAGLAAPADLAVIGVDDIPAARLAAPPLTTVTTDQRAVATHIAATVVAAVTGGTHPPPPGPDIVQVVRRDTA